MAIRGDRVAPQQVRLTHPLFRWPWFIRVLFWVVKGLFRQAVTLGLYWWVSLPVFLLLCAWSELGNIGFGVLMLVLVGAMLAWATGHPASWEATVGRFYYAKWRQHWVYQRRWRELTAACGLARKSGGAIYYPQIRKVLCDQWGDVVIVRMLTGQHPQDWAEQMGRFGHTYGTLRITAFAYASTMDEVRLRMLYLDPLAQVLKPFPVPAVPDVRALPVAISEDGLVQSIAVKWHVLIAGATGSGKGSVLWAILSALAGGIRSGLVQVHAFDPKGGMELAFGSKLFHRFYYEDPENMAGALEDLAKIVRQRADRYRGVQRDHTATMDEPTIIVLIDEFAALTAYTDKKTKERINLAMPIILSQGRAVGVHVIAAVQDGRKEVVPYRNLFMNRIALRLAEESEVDMILGEGAVDRGAACHHIPESAPGVGYRVLEGSPVPVRLRFPYHDDDNIKQLAETYRPQTTTEEGN